MKRLSLIYIIFVILLLPTFLFSQGWEKTYGGELLDWGFSVQQTTDSGYVITGFTESYGFGAKDVYLIKTDRHGNILWTKTYGGENNDVGKSVLQTTDEGFIITGYTASFGNGLWDVYLIKTDSNGDSLWTKKYGGISWDYGNSVQQTTDEGYIITGVTYSFGNGSYDVYLIKTDSNGDTLWTKTYGGSREDSGNSIQQTSDGGYITTGSSNSFGDGTYDVYLIRTNSNGDSLWTRTYSGEYVDYGQSVQQTTDAGYIITGGTQLSFYSLDDVYLIKTDSIGETLWEKTIGGEWSDWGNSVQQTTDNGYIIAGVTAPVNTLVYLIKTDESGSVMWAKTFGGERYDEGCSVQQTYDGGYIITGYTNSFGNDSWDIYLIKTDENGIITFTTEIPLPSPTRKLVKTIDLLGREITKPEKNKPYIEIYDDGTTQKKMNIK